MTLLLAAGMFTVTALANTYPTSASITYDDPVIRFTFEDDTDFTVVLLPGEDVFRDGSGNEIAVAMDEYRITSAPGDFELALPILTSSYEAAPDGVYTLTLHLYDDTEGEFGTIEVTLTKTSEQESSEESSEPEDSSEDSSEPEDESSTTEDESSATEDESSATEEESSTAEDESSAAESESESSESSQSSKTSKPQNPGKPDELSMGGGTAASASGDDKAAPDTGMSYAPLAAMGLIAISALAVVAFKKR